MIKKFSRPSCSALVLFMACSAANAAIITNGSLTGPLANSGVPTGWTLMEDSPDTNDENNAANAGNIYSVTASTSPDGGTWVGVGRQTSTGFNERFGQDITGLTIGTLYELTWFDAHFGAAAGPGYTQDNAFEVLLDGLSVGTGNTLSVTASVWNSESLLFTATSTSYQLAFQLAMDGPSYLQIDGISLQAADINPVPEPASIALVALGLAGMGIRRKVAN